MRINFPNVIDHALISLMLSQLEVRAAALDDLVFMACADLFDYPDFQIAKGDIIIPCCAGGVLVITPDTHDMLVIDSATLDNETFNVPIEPVKYSATLTLQPIS